MCLKHEQKATAKQGRGHCTGVGDRQGAEQRVEPTDTVGTQQLKANRGTQLILESTAERRAGRKTHFWAAGVWGEGSRKQK